MSDNVLLQQKAPKLIVVMAFDRDEEGEPTMLFMAGEVPDME